MPQFNVQQSDSDFQRGESGRHHRAGQGQDRYGQQETSAETDLEVWWCSQCGYGMMKYKGEKQCLACGRYRDIYDEVKTMKSRKFKRNGYLQNHS